MTLNAREFLQTDVVLPGIIIYALLGKARRRADERAGPTHTFLTSRPAARRYPGGGSMKRLAH
jgi:sulfonate transport system permease protein